jgi:hypothetical protein
MGGWVDKVKLMLTQPHVELEAWAALGDFCLILEQLDFGDSASIQFIS